MLSIQNVHVRIGGAVLLRGVTLDVMRGTFVAVVGPNGAGKSTLLRVAAGEVRPDEGRVLLGDEPLAAIPPGVLARRRAVLPQESVLNFPFTVFEVALLGRTAHRATRAADADAALCALRAADVADLAERRFPTLSGGEKQRVHLARALAQLDGPDAALLLLDEPTASLDLAHQHRVLAGARRLARGEGDRPPLAVVAVLHDLNLAAQYADRIAVLKRGELLAEGLPADVLRPDIVQAAFDVRVLVVPHPVFDCVLVVPA